GHCGLLPVQDKNYAVVFLVPTNAPGVKFICRVSNEQRAAVLGTPFDYPLSSRLDENDAIFIMDDVLVPWENVFVYGDIDKANSFFPRSGFVPRFQLHGCTRLAVKLDFITGLLIKATETAGTRGFRGVEANIGEVITWRNAMWALSDAMAKSPEPWTDGFVLPGSEPGAAYHVLGPEAYVQVKHQIERTVAGSHEEIRRFALLSAVATGQYERWKSFADSCMAEYDLDGWTAPDLVNPDDVSSLRQARVRD